MVLKDFVSSSLLQIAEGLIDSNEKIKRLSPNSKGVGYGSKKIQFDIGVHSNEGNNSGIQGEIVVANFFQFSAGTEKTMGSTNMHRIKFDVLLDIDANSKA